MTTAHSEPQKRDPNAALDDARCEGTSIAIAAATYEICSNNVRDMINDRTFYAEILKDPTQKARHPHARKVIDDVDRNLPAAEERLAHASAELRKATLAAFWAEMTGQTSLFGAAR